MNGQSTFSEAPAKPEQILGIFQDWQRLELGRLPDEKDALTFNTTVHEWLDSADFLDWKTVSKGLNEFFTTNFSKDEWRTAMKPEKKKTLRDVCTLISSRATLPTLNEAKFLGASCKTASAFLALRARLQLAGVDATKLLPSARLDDFLRLHTQAMANAILKLAPGRMPKVKAKSNLAHRLFAWTALACLVILIMSEIFSANFWSVISCMALILSFIGLTVCSHFPPARVQIEGLETFADLSRMIAGEIEPKKA
ncbi:MAG: hypothetical protein ABSF10_06620 [Verrucomicrobiota bacterium]|jgi:hypothetical protein